VEVSRSNFLSSGSQFEGKEDDQEDEDGEGNGDDNPKQDLDSISNNKFIYQKAWTFHIIFNE